MKAHLKPNKCPVERHANHNILLMDSREGNITPFNTENSSSFYTI